jgi:hypothetical protein
MDPRVLARRSGLLGGLCWVLRMVLGVTGTSTGVLANLPFWVGAAVLAVALAVGGSELVSTGTRWLRALVALAFPLLVASVLEFLHPYGDPQVIDGVFAVAVLVWAALGLRRLGAEHRRPVPQRRLEPQRRQQPQRSRSRPSGSHTR